MNTMRLKVRMRPALTLMPLELVLWPVLVMDVSILTVL